MKQKIKQLTKTFNEKDIKLGPTNKGKQLLNKFHFLPIDHFEIQDTNDKHFSYTFNMSSISFLPENLDLYDNHINCVFEIEIHNYVCGKYFIKGIHNDEHVYSMVCVVNNSKTLIGASYYIDYKCKLLDKFINNIISDKDPFEFVLLARLNKNNNDFPWHIVDDNCWDSLLRADPSFIKHCNKDILSYETLKSVTSKHPTLMKELQHYIIKSELEN